MKKYYLAYGSNLSVRQMCLRCPNAIYVGKATIPDYQLLFKGSGSGNYLTIEPKKGFDVPVLVWEITQSDEGRLDVYEGYPGFYYKKTFQVDLLTLTDGSKMGTIEAEAYIMHENRKLGAPSLHYLDVCFAGYNLFGFDLGYLRDAVCASAPASAAKQLLKGCGFFE